MTRKELYAQIMKFNLQGKVKEKYGVNYTNCRNVELLEVIEGEINKAKATKTKTSTGCSKVLDKRFDILVNILRERHLLLKSDVEKIMNV